MRDDAGDARGTGHVAVIINPMSGRDGHRSATAADRIALAERVTRDLGVPAGIRVTLARGHAADLAREALASDAAGIIAWGGDGTINEVAGPLLGTSVPLGLVPGGSGNGLARSLRLHTDPATALRDALCGPARPMDVGHLGDRHFLNIGGVGFDAFVADAFNRRAVRGLRGYVLAAVPGAFRYGCEACTVTCGDWRAAGPHFLIAFANGREYGNRLVIAPTADPEDGWLDAVVVAGGSAWRQIWRARRLAFRRLAPAAGITRHRVRQATVEGPRLLAHVDGETFTATGRLDVRLQAAGLLVRRPV